MRRISLKHGILLLCGLLLVIFSQSYSNVLRNVGSEFVTNLRKEEYNKYLPSGQDKSVDTFQPNNLGVCEGRRWPADLPPLYIITPTYPRAEQVAELTRTGQTLLHVDALVWIVAEDTAKPTQAVLKHLKSSGLCYVYLRVQMPPQYATKKHKPRGVANRNAGINWVRQNAKRGGVFYFADDDNTYNIKLFEQIRGTKKVSMFPVGLVTQLHLSSPIVRGGKITGYYDGFTHGRRFPVDMAGFAINVNLIVDKNETSMPFVMKQEETVFLERLNVTENDIELLANSCTEILVWHTQTQKKDPPLKPPRKFSIAGTNIQALNAQLWRNETSE